MRSSRGSACATRSSCGRDSTGQTSRFDVVGIDGAGTRARKGALLSLALSDASMRPAIVYCGTRRDVEEVTELLRSEQLLAVGYHAGMALDERASAQHRFMTGDAEIVVATNAFGMGVDKADVRAVIHWAIPTSVEGYYQEVGRAGRDGMPARAILLSSRSDLGRLINFIRRDAIEPDDVLAFVRRLESRGARDTLELDPLIRRPRTNLPRGRRARRLLSIGARSWRPFGRDLDRGRHDCPAHRDLPRGPRPSVAPLPRRRVVRVRIRCLPPSHPARPLRRPPPQRSDCPLLRHL